MAVSGIISIEFVIFFIAIEPVYAGSIACEEQQSKVWRSDRWYKYIRLLIESTKYYEQQQLKDNKEFITKLTSIVEFPPECASYWNDARGRVEIRSEQHESEATLQWSDNFPARYSHRTHINLVNEKIISATSSIAATFGSSSQIYT